jgi:hypothetical protein
VKVLEDFKGLVDGHLAVDAEVALASMDLCLGTLAWAARPQDVALSIVTPV